jgi:transcriptional regulator with XRE-family HTH domain
MEMKDRIKELRKSIGISQPVFAKKISISKGYIANLELGQKINDRIVKLICQEFNVNEDWLRTGNGTMFIEKDLEMLELLGEKINSLSDFQINLMKTVIKLTPEQADLLNSIIKQLNEGI